MEYLGAISEETSEMFHDLHEDFADEMGMQIRIAKMMLIKFVLAPGSPGRKMLVDQLVEHGYLDKDESDPVAINRELVSLLLTNLAKWRLLSYYEAALLMGIFDKNPDNISYVLDKVIDKVKSNCIGAAGGEFIAWILPWVARWTVVDKYGPFYPKVQSAFA